jgi:hypothetical protein
MTLLEETLTDPLDIGTALAESERERLVAECRARSAPGQTQNEDGSWPIVECVVCGEPIETPRIELGFITCIECAIAYERLMGHHVTR